MNKEIINLNNTSSMFSKDNINGLILEINKLQINKDMKKLILVSSMNLLSSVKTSKALIYQLKNYKSQDEVSLDKLRSKYVHKIIEELNSMPIIDLRKTIDETIEYLEKNNISIKA